VSSPSPSSSPAAGQHPAGPALGLLGEGDPPPFTVECPAGASDFFLIADHAGKVLPRRVGDLGITRPELERHIGWDIGIAGVTRALARRLDAFAVLQTYSRLVIDCNRTPGTPPSIVTLSEDTVIPGNQGLAATEAEARAREIFLPYHDRIRQELDARRAAGRPTVLIAMHSFTPVFKGQGRVWHAGVLHGRDSRVARPLLELLRAEPHLVIGDNEPYAVSEATDYSVTTHGERRGLLHVELELRQDLIGEPEGQEAWAARLERLFLTLRERLAPLP
jgi:predicted N-formylglutamate amidohydrolase